MNAQVNWGHTYPQREEFLELAKTYRVIPLARRLLADEVTALGLYRALATSGPRFILESSAGDGAWDRWSFIGLDPLALLSGNANEVSWSGTVPAGLSKSGPASKLIPEALRVLKAPRLQALPPLTGALVGYLGWEIIREWEPTLLSQREAGSIPDVAMMLATSIIAIDHYTGSVWLVANAINANGLATGAQAAYLHANERLDALQQQISGEIRPDVKSARQNAQVSTPVSPVSQEEFENAVKAAKGHIGDGDVFQLVLSKPFHVENAPKPLDIYRALRAINPSPYMYCLEIPELDIAVVGSSPETLVRVTGKNVTTFPIAGSRPRGNTRQADLEMERNLLADPKERSEHVMLVDLARNDISKIAKPESVAVSEFMRIKRYSHIMHITSTVEGQLLPECDAFQALQATFPAGTLSGAPKPMAVKLIDEYEGEPRGIYGGVVGYFDFAGDADLAIAIRTVVVHRSRATVRAGAGIVADSSPASEHAEVCTKAAAALGAIARAQELSQ